MALPKWNRRDYYNKVVVNGRLELDLLSFRWIEFAQSIKVVQCNTHMVREHELGRMWQISQKHYGTGNLDMLLCMINGIMDPINGMFIGQRLAIPPISAFENYYQQLRAAARNRETVSLPIVTI